MKYDAPALSPRLARLALGVAAIACGLLLSSHARADLVPPLSGAGALGAAAGAALLTGAMLAVAVWLRLRLADALRWGAARDAEAGLQAAMLAAAPSAACVWHDPEPPQPDEGFTRLFGLDRVDGFADIAAVLVPEDAAGLGVAFARLRQTGSEFRLTVATLDRARRIEVTGRRGTAGAVTIDLLWAAEVTAREAVREQEAVRAAEALAAEQRSRAELGVLLDALPLPVWLRRDDLDLVWVNAAYGRALDRSPAEIVAAQRELGAGVIGGGGRALATQARATGHPQSESQHVVVAGERRLLAFTEAPLRLAAGEAGGVAPHAEPQPTIGYALDLTALEDAQAELERHIAAHAEVLEHLKSAIAIFGPHKRLTFFNQTYVLLTGFDEHWLDSQPTLGEMLEQLRERRRLPEYANFPAYKKSMLDLFTSLLEPREDLLHLPDGHALRQIITPHPFGGLLFVLEDVTSALTLERNYNTLMAVQQESLDNLAEGIAVFGGDGRLRLSNPSFARMWELSPDDLAGHPHVAEIIDKTRRFFDPEDNWSARRAALVVAALEREATRGRLERTDGSVLDFATVPLPDGAVLNRYLDVTDSVKVEQALRASNEALETADRLKSEFIANVSYQLRTPLNAIMGFAEILNNAYFGELNERQREYTESILEASQRLLSLINDILDLATIEAGYMALDRREVDIPQMLRSVYDLTREWAGKQNLKVTIACLPDIGTIEADERRLKQALYNLVSNAIKFTLPGGRITLSAVRDENEVRLTVADTGISIPEADRDRVFGRFERAHPQMRLTGVGLGLALVKSFIEMHGGRVELDTQQGEGTTVSCILPARTLQQTAAAVPARPKARSAYGG